MDLASRIPALLARARALLGLPGGPPDRLAATEIGRAATAVEALHEGLVGRRDLANVATYGERAHLGAYLLWWWPQTYAKVKSVLRLVPDLPRGPRILDVGAGPAPAALALLDALGGEAVALDASEAALSEARSLAGAAPLRTLRGDASVAKSAGGPFDVVVLANVLSEIPQPDRDGLVTTLPLAPGGHVLLVEPALRETGRALLAFRDRALSRGFRAVAPCLTQKPCPALASPRDWCTACEDWEPPPHVTQLADATGLRADEALSYAPLVLAREAAEPRPGVWRVVGVAPPEKGKKRLWVCSDDGRLPLVRLDRDASPANARFDALRRGDLVEVEDAEQRGDGLRIVAATHLATP
ncbi:MAG: small ribosomal subunit Rsm22 family protein [Myxococcales bacterium]